jgi:hypothetical protein
MQVHNHIRGWTHIDATVHYTFTFAAQVPVKIDLVYFIARAINPRHAANIIWKYTHK